MTQQDTLIAEGLKMIEASQNASAVQAVKTDEATDKQKEAVQYTICPCCGKPTLVKPVEIKGELLDHYMSCLISGVPFSHTYPVYKGKLEVTVTQLSKEMATAIVNACNVLDLCKSKVPKLDTIIRDFIGSLKLYCSISAIEVKTGEDLKNFYPAEMTKAVCTDLAAMRMDILSDTMNEDDLYTKVMAEYKTITNPSIVSAVPGLMLAGIVETHNQLYNILLESGFDSNFWEGIELA